MMWTTVRFQAVYATAYLLVGNAATDRVMEEDFRDRHFSKDDFRKLRHIVTHKNHKSLNL